MIDFNDIDDEEMNENSWEFERSRTYWTTSNKTKISLDKLDNGHLNNILFFMKRRGITDKFTSLLSKEKQFRKDNRIVIPENKNKNKSKRTRRNGRTLG